jgi:hypothetical protein
VSDIVRDTIASLIAVLQVESSTAVAPFGYGRDLVCVDDIDPQLAETDPDGLESFAQDLYHRLTTARGSLPDDPNFGFDVRALLSKGLTQADIRSAVTQIEGELQKDDRGVAYEVELTQTGSLAIPSWLLRITVTPADGSSTFDLVLAVTGGEALLQEITK